MLYETAYNFGKEKMAPFASKWDQEHHFPGLCVGLLFFSLVVDVLREAASLGFAGIYVKEDVGGSALGRTQVRLFVVVELCRNRY